MVGRLAAWVGRATQQTPPPPYVLTRAWSRFQMTLTNIDETLGPRRWSLGRLFHRYAVAFLNALLVEEALHRSQADFPTRNPVSDDAQFVRNLNRSAAHPFFDYVWTCPLWGAFLNPDTELYKLYLAATAFNDRAVWRVSYAIDPARRVDFDNLYPVLNSIPVIGMRRRSGSARRRAGKKIET
jgi:hypothetical protein